MTGKTLTRLIEKWEVKRKDLAYVLGISISKVYNAIFSFAEENNLTLEEHYVEYFPTKDEVIVQIRIKDE